MGSDASRGPFRNAPIGEVEGRSGATNTTSCLMRARADQARTSLAEQDGNHNIPIPHTLCADRADDLHLANEVGASAIQKDVMASMAASILTCSATMQDGAARIANRLGCLLAGAIDAMTVQELKQCRAIVVPTTVGASDLFQSALNTVQDIMRREGADAEGYESRVRRVTNLRT